jgi:single-strand DNA-binding protein
MANLNRVLLIGNLTRDPELRYIQNGSAVVNMRIAVNRYYTTQSGEKKQDTCYVTVVAWSRLAELCSEYLSKGKSVFVEGRLQNRSWETETGEKRNTLEIVADHIHFLDRRDFQTASAEPPPPSAEEKSPEPEVKEELPF